MHRRQMNAGAEARSLPLACALALYSLAFAAQPVFAQGTTSVYSEEHRRVRGSSNVDALGPNLFGDRVSLYSGRVEFVQQDLELPGNNALFMGIARRLTTGRDMVNNAGMFGDWDLELPRLHGIFASGSRNYGWAVGDYLPDIYKRCTQFAAPPVGFAIGGSGYVWEPEEYWFGNNLYVPGQGSQPILTRSAANNLQPTGGGYPLVTKGGWQIQCLPSIANNQGFGNAQGEAFTALAPDGTRWRFDQLVERRTTTLTKAQTAGGSGAFKGTAKQVPAAEAVEPAPSTDGVYAPILPQPSVTMGYRLERAEVWLLPTQATDRFGNTVTYTYDSTNPWKLMSIQSSDGRNITFTHDGTSARIRTVNDGTRTWTYEYSGSTLTRVLRPDGSTWQFSGTFLFKNNGPAYVANPGCDSGAVGQFTVSSVTHGRTDVPRFCYAVGGSTRASIPNFFADRSLISKVLSGPGLSTASWVYAYSAATPSWAPCGSGCVPTKTVTVTDPAGVVTRSTFGTRYANNEGKLLLEEVLASNGTVLRSTSHRYRSPSAGPYPDPVGYNPHQLIDNHESTRHHPTDQRLITQQGSSFTWQADAFDVRARPTQITRSSSLGFSRTETTAYYDNTSRWVLGQIASVTVAPGLVAEQHDYDPTTALRTRSYAFGLLKRQFSYHPDGNLYTKADAVNPPTVMTNYWRGVPRNVAYPGGSGESATVNNLGLVTSHTNAAGSTTWYGYDAIGRLASISHPAEPTGGYHATVITHEQVPYPDRGLAAGHWRQTTATDNARSVRYFDAMWRQRLSYQYDAGNEAATSRAVETRFDADGRKIFESYPQRSLGQVDTYRPGQSWTHDALDRVLTQQQDSELGTLTTSTEYLGGFVKRVTNPRGHATTFSYQAFDQPSEDSIATISAPEGVSLAIPRDVFGKALSVTRSGSWAGGGVSATRSYVYDAHQRLCKTVEPESGATIQAYDAAGNIAWRASGQGATSTGSCDHAAVGPATKMSFGYDALNRLTSTSFGDGQPGITRSYTPDGLLQQTVSSSFTWTYGYNNRRLLTQEALSVPNQTPGAGWNFSYSTDAYGNVHTLTDPWGSIVYAPNALGEATQVSGYVSGVSYHPNGMVAGYTLANGITRRVSQNARGLPDEWQDTGVIFDAYRYDANGNTTAILDWQWAETRSMGYDALDRLTTANGVWGTGQYGYDGLDNLRSSQVGGRSLSHHVDGSNRLSSLSGSQSVSFGYDLNGNITQRGSQGYSFDIANRMRAAHGKATYDYDGHGRRGWVVWANGSTQLNAYTGTGNAGRLLFSNHSSKGGTRYVYLRDKLIAEHNNQTGVSYSHTDALGSPVARTNSAGQIVGNRTRYEPYGETAAGDVPQGIGFTGHVNDADTGLVYMQQRYYDPIAGRFFSVDPVVTDWDSGGQFNRYVYAYNNPYGFVDPDGRLACSSGNERCHQQREEAERRGIPLFDGGGSGAATPPSGAANAPGGPYFEPTWGEVGVGVGIGAGTAAAAAAPQVIVIVGARLAAGGVANPVSGTLARVVPGNLKPTSLGKPGDLDVFVTNARELRGLSANQIAGKLAIPQSSSLRVIEFPSASVQGIASPIARTNPGFVGGGKTAGGASEFVIPNGPIPVGAAQRVVH
jgi:RHS repeat-associated protein